MESKDFKNYIGLDCLIYDGGDPVQGRIEGIDIVANTVIADRANYKPCQIKPFLKKINSENLFKYIPLNQDDIGLINHVFTFKRPIGLQYSHIKLLIENGFDLENLIEKNLAVDEKTLEL